MLNKTLTTKKIVMTAMLAALVAASSALRITVPADITGTSSFHLGNILCALSGILLGPWLGGLAAGLGSAIYDMFNPLYISECWMTFLMKGAYGLAAGSIAWWAGKAWTPKGGVAWVKSVAATIIGALTYAALYLGKSYFYSGLLMKGLTPDAALVAMLSKIPATIFNMVVAIVGAPILAFAVATALDKAHLRLD